MHRPTILYVLLFLAAWCPSLAKGQGEFQPRRVIRDPFPTIKSPKTKACRDVAGMINDNELVLGVTIGAESRAYPINMLTGPRREIINDTLGGTAIAATW